VAVLVIADQWDPHADKVCGVLAARSHRYFRLDLDVERLKGTTLLLAGDRQEIRTPSDRIDLQEVGAVWSRRLSVVLSLQEEHGEQSSGFQIWKAEWNRHLYWLYEELRSAYWLNPIVAGGQADNKRRQMHLAQRVGLRMPETIASNDKAGLVAFARQHDEVALKFLSQAIVQDERGFLGIYVNKIRAEDLASFSEQGEQPVLLQRYVKKDFEVRYTVVGGDHYVCQIESQRSDKTAVDWRRYDVARTPHRQIEAPPEVRAAVTEFMSSLSIDFGALDFVVDPDGKWWFLEINANGQWLWIEDLVGFDISARIAAMLAQRDGAK